MAESDGLGTFGLPHNAHAAYRMLLRDPGADVQEVARQLGTGIRSGRRALTDLIEAELVSPQREGRSVRYYPRDPEPVLGALLVRQQAEVEAIRTVIADLARSYRESAMVHGSDSVVEVLSGRDEVQHRLRALHASSTQELMSFDCPPYIFDMTNNEIEVENERLLLERGVRVRCVYRPDAFEYPGRYDTVLKLAELGEEPRTWSDVPTKLSIYDRSIAMVPLLTKQDNATNVIMVKPCGLLDALLALFELTWIRASPIQRPAAVSTTAHPPSQTDQIAAMLASGMSDKLICSQLGLSDRTLRRRMDQLHDRLGARSRFQAGYNLARRALEQTDDSAAPVERPHGEN